MTKTEREPTVVPESPQVGPEVLSVLAARAASALKASLQSLVCARDQNLGHLERQAEQDVRALLRQTLCSRRKARALSLPSNTRCTPSNPYCSSLTSQHGKV